MADKEGAVFAARVSGVQRFGLFVTLSESGASGLVPMAALPDDYWMYDEGTHSLSGRRTRMTYHLAQDVEVRLSEANPVTGGLIFQMVSPARADRTPQSPPRGARGERRSRRG